MNKSLLNTFIRKYHLKGNPPVESVVWKVEDNKLTTRFMTDDQSVIGEVTLKSFKFDDVEFGIYVTSQLYKMLGVMMNEVDLTLEKKADKLVSIQFSDGKAKMNFMLAEMTIIPNVPSLKQEPDFDISIKMTKEFMQRFIKSKGALAEVETFTFLVEDEQPKLVIGYSSTINSNKIGLDVECTVPADMEPISFSAEYFKEILVANREAEEATLRISTEGLAKISFDINDFLSEYYLVEIASGT